jgi:hypothetical protein
MAMIDDRDRALDRQLAKIELCSTRFNQLCRDLRSAGATEDTIISALELTLEAQKRQRSPVFA